MHEIQFSSSFIIINIWQIIDTYEENEWPNIDP